MLALAAAGFTLGLLYPWPLPGFWVRFAVVLLLLVVLAFRLFSARGLPDRWAFLLLLLWVALGVLRAWQPPLRFPEGRVWLTGVVQVPVERRAESTRLRLRLTSWRSGYWGGKISSSALLSLHELLPDLMPGETLRLAGELTPTVGPRNPGDFDERAYWGLRGVEARIVHASSVERLGVHGVRGHWTWLIGRMRASVREWVERHLDSGTATLADALMLGDRSGWGESTRETLARSGLMHLFAISGLHTGILAAILYAALSIFGLPRRLVQLVTLALFWLYVPFTGANPPVLRAVVILSLFLLGSLFRRQNRIGYALAIAWIGLLAWRPEGLRDVGFQLTFAGSLGTIYAGSVFKDLMKTSHGRRFLPKFIRGPRPLRWTTLYALLISFGALLATAPIIVFHFGRLPWLGPVVTVIATPLLALTMIAGWLTVIFSSLPGVGQLFGDALWGLLQALDWIAGASANWLPVSEFLPARASIAAALVALILFATARQLREHPLRGLLFTALLIATASIWTSNWLPADRLKLGVLDVGQGDGVLLRRGKRALIIDGGRASSRAMLRQLRLLGIERVELLVLTHGDVDHAGAAAEIVKSVPVRAALVGPGLWRDPGGRHALAALADRQVPTFVGRRGVEVDLGDLGELDLLAPPQDIVESPSATDNELSLVSLWSGGGVKLLFPGDAGATVERELLQTGKLPEVELLVAGHHGSRYSTTTEWLRTLSPEVVVISAGRNNPYGHPSVDLLQRLAQEGIRPYRTDTSGAILFSVERGSLPYLRPSEWW